LGSALFSRDRVALAIGGLALALVPGCVTSSEGEAMRTETTRLRQRIDTMDKKYAEATKDMERLRQILDEATALLTRNSADLGAKVDRHDQEIAALNGKMEEAKHLLAELQKKVGDEAGVLAQRLSALETGQQKIVDKVAPAMPEDKEALWTEADTRLRAGQREEARRFYRAFVKRFPTDPRAPRALIASGKAFAEEAKHTQAAGEYQQVLDGYPKSEEVPEAMFRLGEAFVELKFCSDAKAIFTDLTKRYRRSPHADGARDQLKTLARIAKDRTRCTS
jgi:TolA-binding protein